MGTRTSDSRICLIDDDPVVRDSLIALFRSRGLRVSGFADPERFLSIWLNSELREVPASFVVDIGMPGISGMELFQRMRAHGLPTHNSVLFLTGHGDVPMAVDAMRHGAFDFIEKPFSDNSLVDRVLDSLRLAESEHARAGGQLHFLSSLSPKELQVAELIMRGLTNKEIAKALDTSVRTVEVHRLRVFRKLGVRNATTLVAAFQGVGLNEAHGAGLAGLPGIA